MALPTPQLNPLSTPSIDREISVDTSGVGRDLLEIGTAIGAQVQSSRLANAEESLALELDQETNDWWDATRNATASPNVVDILDADADEFADAPEPVKELMTEVAKQRLAAEQGAITGTELKVRHESTLRKYLNRYPQFTPELQAAAGRALGYNPLGAHIDQMMENLAGSTESAGAEWAALDKYADAVGVNMTLKYTSPVQYYSQVMGFAQRDTELEFFKRETEILKTQTEFDNITQLKEFKRAVAPVIFGRAAGLTEKISGMIPRGPEGKAEFANEILPQVRNMVAGFLAQSRMDITKMFPEINQEQLDGFMRPIENNMELVLRSANPQELQTALEMYRTQAQAKVYAEFPEYVNMEMAAEIMRDLPSISQLLVKGDLANTFSSMVFRLTGATDIHGAIGAFDPAVSSNEDRDAYYSGAVQGMVALLAGAKDKPERYPVLKRFALEFYKNLRAENDLPEGKRSAGSATANMAFLKFWEDPESAKILQNSPPTNQEAQLVVDSVKFATDQLRLLARQDADHFSSIRASNIAVGFGGTLRDERPGQSRVPITIDDIMEMSLVGSTVQLSVNWGNVGLDEAKIPPNTKKAVNDMVAQASIRFGTRLSQAIRLIAHIQGSTDYASVASRYSDELKAPLLEALMLPQG